MSLAAQITPTGMVVPSYEDILASLILSFQSIYGADIYLGNDSQDYQMLAIFATAINDVNQTALATYNAYSPATAQGAGLSSIVKINGIRREVASNSTAILTLIGQAGIPINNGIVADIVGNQWLLPASVTIPLSGTIDVTATAATPGNISAIANTITKIATPTLGWQSANNAAAATLGAPVEVDPTLRQRQAISTSLPALSVVDSMLGAIANLPGVQRYVSYENDTDTTDANGIPRHSLSFVVEGGNIQDIGNVIALKKTPGTGTYGTQTVIAIDSRGVAISINFFVLTEVLITVEIDITALAGYVASTGTSIIATVASALSALGIGEDVLISKMYTPANLNGSPLAITYDITAIKIKRGSGTLAPANVAIAFNEAAFCGIVNVNLVVS